MAASTELAPYGITANIVHPPVTDTGWITDEVRRASAPTNLVSVGGSVANFSREGIFASAVDGATSITNAGSVTGTLAGIRAQSSGTGSILVTNTGSVTGGLNAISRADGKRRHQCPK